MNVQFMQIDQEKLVALFQQGIKIEVENLVKKLSVLNCTISHLMKLFLKRIKLWVSIPYL